MLITIAMRKTGCKSMRRKQIKNKIPKVKILGVKIAAIDMKWLMSFTKAYIKELSGDYICVSNVHTTVTAYKDREYRKIQNGGIMAIPDGGPLSFVGRRRGYKMSRTTGPDYMEEVFKLSLKQGYRHFFYGSTVETLDKLKKVLEKEYPGIIIAGMYSPPFRQMTEEEDKAIIKVINSAEPDFIWVGLGAPKQEKWMAEHQGKLKGVMIGVGAGFDYKAGKLKRAPMWMQRANLEWLYRMIQEPKRLFKRYLVTNSVFIWNAVIKGK